MFAVLMDSTWEFMLTVFSDYATKCNIVCVVIKAKCRYDFTGERDGYYI